MKDILPYLFLLTSIFFSCSNDTTDQDEDTVIEEPTPNINALYFPPISSNEWETVSIENLAWNVSAEQPLYDFLEERNTKAFIVLKNGRIVIERYFNGGAISDSNPWNSAGKTLSAFTVGIAQQEGFLDINESSSSYLGTQWANITVDQEQSITVRNHLTMTTGLDYTNIFLQNCTNFNCFTYLNEPGNFWYYHNAAYTILNNLVEGATQMDFSDYFDSRLRNLDRNGWRLDFCWIYQHISQYC